MNHSDTTSTAAVQWRWRRSVELAWFATTALLIVVAVSESDWPAYCFAAFFALMCAHYLRRGRALSPNAYMTTAAFIILGSLLSATAFWSEPSGGIWETISVVAILAFLFFASVQSLRPIILGETTRSSIVAMDDPETRRSHRLYAISTLLILVLGLALLTVFVAGAIVSQENQTSLETNGASTDGVVTRLGGNGLLGGNTVLVTFNFEGNTRTEAIQLNSNSPRYKIGDGVEVLIDSGDPSRVSLRDESNDSRLFVMVIVVFLVTGFVAFIVAMGRIAALARQHQLFTTTSWRTAQVQYRATGKWQHSIHHLRITDGLEIRSVTINEPFWVLWPKAEQQAGQTLQLIGDCDRHGIVKLQGSNKLWHVLAARPDRSDPGREDS